MHNVFTLALELNCPSWIDSSWVAGVELTWSIFFNFFYFCKTMNLMNLLKFQPTFMKWIHTHTLYIWNTFLDFNSLQTMDEEGPSASMENAIINYLNTKRLIQRMKQQIDATSNSIQQRKRTNGNYWKMCAFNAVSCFG